jgi:hypothetical protein
VEESDAEKTQVASWEDQQLAEQQAQNYQQGQPVPNQPGNQPPQSNIGSEQFYASTTENNQQLPPNIGQLQQNGGQGWNVQQPQPNVGQAWNANQQPPQQPDAGQGWNGGQQQPPQQTPAWSGGPQQPRRADKSSKSKMLIAVVFCVLALVGGAVAYAAARPVLPPPLGSAGVKTPVPTPGSTKPTPTPFNEPTQAPQKTVPAGTVPANNATFQIKVTLTLKASNDNGSNTAIWGRNTSETITLQVSNGKVCQVRDDGRTVRESFNLANSLPGDKWTFERKFSCTGSYKDGKLTYTETVTSETLRGEGSPTASSTAQLASNTCPAKQYVYNQLEGTFSSSTAVSGDFIWSGTTIGRCGSLSPVKGTGTWSSEIAA